MDKEQWIGGISKEELAFRMFERGHFGLTCLKCVFYKPDEYGKRKCASEANEAGCEREYEEWLESEMD